MIEALKAQRLWIAAAAGVCLSACTSGLLDNKQPIQQTYVIGSAPAQPAAEGALAVDLTVSRPTVRPGLDTDRIAVLYPDRRLDYYAGSRWGASASLVVQTLLVESLRNSGRLRTAQSDFSAFGGNYLLQTELRDFQAEYASGSRTPVAHVTLVCTLGQVKGRQPLASYSASASVPAASDNLRAVVAAFETAYHEAAQSIVTQTAGALTQALQAPPAGSSAN